MNLHNHEILNLALTILGEITNVDLQTSTSAIRFDYNGKRYRVNHRLFVEEVDGEFLTTSDEAELVQSKLRGIRTEKQLEKEFQEKLDETVFLVEATNFEQFALWKMWSPKSDTQCYKRLDSWEQDQCGQWFTIGHLDNRPICISVTWAILNGKRVMFWDMTSQLQDYKMAEDFWEKHFHGKWDNGRRKAMEDANNFHLCVDAVING